MHVVITRPREDADDLAADVAARGHEPVLAPLLEIELVRPAGGDLEGTLSGVQALAFTSSNGVRAAAHLNLPRQLPVFAVGDATAQSAEAAGFRQVESASGDAAALARLIRRRLDSRDGPVLHLSGEAIAGRLAEDLQASGFALRRVIGYRAQPVQRLPDA
ncbi:MAG: uroporphyrinogen-III synthase, partial [Rhodovibrionaceae bacterium]|nr:uroporphyrinogen-III synthase [Rhodovibrionaceae bacterium]